MKSHSSQTLSCCLLDIKTVILLVNVISSFGLKMNNFGEFVNNVFIKRFFIIFIKRSFEVFYSWGQRFFYIYIKNNCFKLLICVKKLKDVCCYRFRPM